MKTIIEYTIDKTNWQEGPWQQEPDKKQWLDEATGLPCLIVRHDLMGHLCGYVGVPSGHPWFEKEPDADVHGGVTYGNKCNGHICHIVEEGEDDNIWWIGFDASHAFDRSMLSDTHSKVMEGVECFPNRHDIYRDFAYMEDQCRKLAQQAKEAAL